MLILPLFDFSSNFPSYTPRKSFPEDNYMEFSKKVQDKLIGTREEKAYVSRFCVCVCVYYIYIYIHLYIITLSLLNFS